ncbi:hypothetical protein [Pseudomonas qingdaonensis]|uniref:hypothetical protein n=1 Tax=Pseudomonas qingdaonensis TaxID=2056231 RepID=UPI001F2594B3|nr:hypothetical protein [Pseudomonas qingdaonensis]
MNIGSPIPDPRLQVMADLSVQIDQFFAAGKRLMLIEAGVSGECCGMKNPHQRKQRAARDAAAPMVRELAAQGLNAQEIGEAMKTSHTRIRLIAQENGITLGGSA